MIKYSEPDQFPCSRTIMKHKKTILYLGILLLLFAKPAHAYIDPGAGSYFFQILIAGILGGLFFIKSSFKKIKNFFKREKKKQHKRDDEQTKI